MAAILMGCLFAVGACGHKKSPVTPADHLEARLAAACHVDVGSLVFRSGGEGGFNGTTPYRWTTTGGDHSVVLVHNDQLGGDGRWRVSCDGGTARLITVNGAGLP